MLVDPLDRIHSDPAILRGKPCIRGTRISVQHIVELAASGASRHEIVEAYPHLAEDDVEQALRYAAVCLENETNLVADVPR